MGVESYTTKMSITLLIKSTFLSVNSRRVKNQLSVALIVGQNILSQRLSISLDSNTIDFRTRVEFTDKGVKNRTSKSIFT